MAFAAMDGNDWTNDAQAGRRGHASQCLQGLLPRLWKGCVHLTTPWRFPWRRLRDSSAAMQDANSGNGRLPWPWHAASLGFVVAAAGIASLTFSYFLDFGMFFGLGVLVAQAPTSALDHLHGWVVWLPFALVLCVPVLAALSAGGSKASESPEGAVPGTSPNPTDKGILRTVSGILAGGIVVFLAAVISEARFPFLAALTGACLSILLMHFLCAKLGASMHFLTRSALMAAPAVVIIAFGLGSQYAHVKALGNESSHRVHTLGVGDGGGFVDVRIVRAFEKWMPVLDKEGNVVWLVLDRVTETRNLGSQYLLAEVLRVVGIHCAKADRPRAREAARTVGAHEPFLRQARCSGRRVRRMRPTGSHLSASQGCSVEAR